MKEFDIFHLHIVQVRTWKRIVFYRVPPHQENLKLLGHFFTYPKSQGIYNILRFGKTFFVFSQKRQLGNAAYFLKLVNQLHLFSITQDIIMS